MAKSLYKGIAKKATPKAKRGQIRITENDDDTVDVGLYVLLPNKNPFYLESRKTTSYANASVIGVGYMTALHGGMYDEKIKEMLVSLQHLKNPNFGLNRNEQEKEK